MKQLIPIRNLLIEIGQTKPNEPAVIYINNQSTVKIATNEQGQQRTNHTDVRGKCLTEKSSDKTITITHVSNDKQIADILTKPLQRSKFQKNRDMFMVTITLLAPATATNSAYLTTPLARTHPLFFVPTDIIYYQTKPTFNLQYTLQNPCDQFFANATPNTTLNEIVLEICSNDYDDIIVRDLPNCHHLGPRSSEPFVSNRTTCLA